MQLKYGPAAHLQEVAADLEQSWQPRAEPFPGRGARLADAAAPPHPVYAVQQFFSIYVHTRPEFPGYPASSVFHGREIAPRAAAERFRHSLGLVSLLLLEAALVDSAVRNARFVVLSESDVPMYNGGLLFLQLLNERRSRLGATRSFEDLLQNDQVRGAGLGDVADAAMCCCNHLCSNSERR
jgi:Core-2/I-Branching enzyme